MEAICSACKRLAYSRRKTFSACAWVFVICSIAGLFIEETYCLIVCGRLENRAGLLFGPFSPIYGVGALCIFAVARMVEKRCLPVQFIAFAATGGLVEYSTSYLMQAFFGIMAWDYSGTFLSIDGRTNGHFMLLWGILGIFCARFVAPLFSNRLLPAIWRLGPKVTKLLLAFMFVDIALTLVAFNSWYLRHDGVAPQTPIQEACAVVFDDAFMADRFQTMSLHPEDALR